MHIIDQTNCQCAHPREDCLHYVLMCPLYRRARAKLKLEIEKYSAWNLDILLFGDKNSTTEKISPHIYWRFWAFLAFLALVIIICFDFLCHLSQLRIEIAWSAQWYFVYMGTIHVTWTCPIGRILSCTCLFRRVSGRRVPVGRDPTWTWFSSRWDLVQLGIIQLETSHWDMTLYKIYSDKSAKISNTANLSDFNGFLNLHI
jgi:hypothetical protein